MKYAFSLGALMLASNALAATVPSSAWSTLTPSATLSGAATDFSATFGIAIQPISSSASASASLNKRDVVSQIGDGQIQATTSTKKTSTKKKTTATADAVVSQITDGQIQATTSTSTKKKTTATADAVVTQIGDGQIQADTTTTTSSKKTADAVVTQIGDGQIQADTTTTSKTSAAVVSQIADGQIQATTSTSSTKTTGVVSQISDGQIQASTSTSSTKTTGVVSQISDGQAQGSTTSSSASATSSADAEETAAEDANVTQVSCYDADALAMTLVDGILYDAKGRIGSIVANRQFQFDGPPPQAGAIYAAGWGISEDGYLAIGKETTFYQCLSGTFYNLYDQSIGSQCSPVHLTVVELETC